ncbi:MAG: hypothetical protein AAGA61_07925 [Pseudomonadota bacterium]
MKRQGILHSLFVVAVVGVAVSGLLDDASRDVAEASFKRALVTFAAARTLNGVISAAQGTEIALEPGGVGVILSIGEALDPINDLIERFSSVMLVAASSLGLQNILLGISRWWGMNLALGIIALGALAAVWLPALEGSATRTVLSRMFLILLFVRFAVPFLILITGLVSQVFLDDSLAESTAVLEATSTEIEALGATEAPDPNPEQGIMDRLGAMLDDSVRSLNAADRLEQLKATASNAAESIINLIVIFVLQTILLPLGIFWLLLEIVKGYVSRFTQR